MKIRGISQKYLALIPLRIMNNVYVGINLNFEIEFCYTLLKFKKATAIK